MKILKLIKYWHLILTRKPTRYKHLYKAVHRNKSKRIMEIGVYHGFNSKLMIETALIEHPKSEVEYYGFDLFEMMNDSDFAKEYSKHPDTMAALKDSLSKTGVKINLYKGYTNDTLPKFVEDCKKQGITMDFIFIDGGHHFETIENDWKYCKELMNENTIVIFDDYFTDASPSIGDVGCQKLIGELDKNKYDVKVLEPQNRFPRDWGTLKINFAQVTLKK